MKKILFYNWINYEDVISRGGGVSVYLRNLFQELNCEKNSEYEYYFLCSGTVYNLKNRVYIEQIKNKDFPKIKSFQIVNSPIIAPANVQFPELSRYLHDETLLGVLKDFFIANNGFDVVHLHNIEGLSINVLKLKELFPETKFILTLHNYYLFCPQVNLWTGENKNCYKSYKFPNCGNCVLHPNPTTERINSVIKYYIGDTKELRETKVFRSLKYTADKIRRQSTKNNSLENKNNMEAIFHVFREKNVDYLNRYCDLILAVSKKVKEIALAMGIESEKLVVNYIGTLAAERFKEISARRIDKDETNIFKMAYLGYAREDKGYGFLLDGLLALPEYIAASTKVYLMAKKERDTNSRNKYEHKEKEIASKFCELIVADGYTRVTQEKILEEIDLGIVPSMWEDNMPQIAIEFVAAGVPIVTSDCGGAQELCLNKDYVFKADSMNEFLNVISNCFKTKCSNWEKGIHLVTMHEHMIELKKLYEMNER